MVIRPDGHSPHCALIHPLPARLVDHGCLQDYNLAAGYSFSPVRAEIRAANSIVGPALHLMDAPDVTGWTRPPVNPGLACNKKTG